MSIKREGDTIIATDVDGEQLYITHTKGFPRWSVTDQEGLLLVFDRATIIEFAEALLADAGPTPEEREQYGEAPQ